MGSSQHRSAGSPGCFAPEIARLKYSGEFRYEPGEILAHERRDMLAFFGASLRLDAANTVNVSGARSFAFADARGQTTLTVSFVRRLGVGGGFGLAGARPKE